LIIALFKIIYHSFNKSAMRFWVHRFCVQGFRAKSIEHRGERKEERGMRYAIPCHR